MYVCVCVYIYIYIYIYTHTRLSFFVINVMCLCLWEGDKEKLYNENIHNLYSSSRSNEFRNFVGERQEKEILSKRINVGIIILKWDGWVWT